MLIGPNIGPWCLLEIGPLLGLARAATAGALSAQASRSREQGSACKPTVSSFCQRASTPTPRPSGLQAGGGLGGTDCQTPGRQEGTLSHLCYASFDPAMSMQMPTHADLQTAMQAYTHNRTHACPNACRICMHAHTHTHTHTQRHSSTRCRCQV